jgi:UPF0755 protein
MTALILVIVLGGGAYGVIQYVLPMIDGLGSTGDQSAEDYPGPGTGEAEVSIPAGATGTAMAEILVEADVVASSRAFTRAFAANPDAAGIQPGTYRLLLQMRAADAVAALLNPENKVQTNVTVPEGFRVTQILERLASTTGVAIEEFQAAMADPAATGLPAEAGGNYEGWLFPATYTFEPGTTPVQMISTMIAETVRVLDERAVPVESRQELLIKASLVERESPGADASPMMARAIQNRLDIGMLLEIDVSVAYGANKSGNDLTTADLEDASNPYNTYEHIGLPPGPIASPGTASIDAVLNPVPGPWKFWVTINKDTGETLFAETYEEHRENVELLRQWEAENE